MARCIVREIKEGRGSPHGGVFLDISWIKKKLPDAAEHIKKKLPSMYHQFKKLADIDITMEPMEVGPTTHYMMGGIRVDADTQMSTVPGLFAAGEAAAGLHGANRLGGNSLSDLWCLEKEPVSMQQSLPKKTNKVAVNEQEIPIFRGKFWNHLNRRRETILFKSVRSAGNDAGSCWYRSQRRRATESNGRIEKTPASLQPGEGDWKQGI